MKCNGLFYIILASLWLTAPTMAPVAHAQERSVITDEQVDPQRLAAARAFLEASNFKKQMSELLQSMMPMMEQEMSTSAERLNGTQFSPKQSEEARKISKLLSKAFIDKFLEKQPEMTELTTLVYARALTVEELNALTKFQKTPTGRKYNEACPEITAEILSQIITGTTTNRPTASSVSLDPEKERAIEEMLEITQFDSMTDLMLEKMAQPTPIGTLPPEISKQKLKEIDAISKARIEEFKSRKQELKQFVISFWEKKLEIEDINATTNFYRTDIGQKILISMPKIYEEDQKLQQKMFTTMFSDMGTMVQDIIKKHQSQQ